MKQLILIITIICLFTQIKILSAQSVSIPAQIPDLEEQVSIFVEPELPKPNEDITIKVEAYGTDLTRAFITWKVNNVVKKSGRGEQTFQLNSGDTGTKQVVLIQIQPFGGPLIQKTLVFKPQEVDLLWEARGYTPPFYKGKSIPTYMGKVKFLAIPQFKDGQTTLSSLNKTFRWSQNHEVINEASGFNKNTLTVTGDILLKPETISVEVADDLFNKATKDVDINFFEPQVFLYERSALYGIMFNQVINDVTLKNKELSVLAIPYFFDTISKQISSLNYNWKINGNDSYLFTKDSATFRYVEGQEGTSVIDVIVKSTTNFLQEARARLNIKLKND